MLKEKDGQSKNATQRNQKEDAQHGDKCPHKKEIQEIKLPEIQIEKEIQMNKETGHQK